MAKHDAKNKKSTKLDSSKRIKKNKSWDPVKIDDEDTDFNQRLPAIFIDIDGVLLKGTGTGGTQMNVIADSDKATKRLLTPLASGGRIPFCFLTNGGMETE
jgi:hypothetical protein